MAKMKRRPLDVGGLMGPITSIPYILMATKRMLDEDVPVLDGQSHCGSDRHGIA